jgi:1,4-dihydroxy-2-naphthoate octaprenyltransferase
MTIATALVLALAILAGLELVWRGGWPVLALGVTALLAALAYTGGPFPLGYHGLGDLFVFLFFGLVGVAGAAFVQTKHLSWFALLAAVPVGCLVTAIIVVNNLRDLPTDRAAGKRTLAVRFGRSGTIAEYALLLAVTFALPPLFWFAGELAWWNWWLPWLSLPLARPLWHGVHTASGPALNPVLAGTARLSLVYALLFALSIVL